MLNETQIHRLAAAAHALRPGWPEKSLVTFLERHHANGAVRDVAIALVWVALDEKTVTPKRMNEAGPWWSATGAGDSPSPLHFDRCPEPGHASFPANNCSACRAEQLENDQPVPTTARPEQAEINRAGAELARSQIRRQREALGEDQPEQENER
ncbi:hypothetical protein GCM10025864_39300 [Luteimicrobium album]|uniref:Uncharacterized protein n=2 Tax=Luteimicrobium album TaxID=1054550 RepID=A0ABQ6I610_9MICO|nr:hypothetical protein GCM10025864_39300 [Luteimicrobium album]